MIIAAYINDSIHFFNDSIKMSFAMNCGQERHMKLANKVYCHGLGINHNRSQVASLNFGFKLAILKFY